MNSDERVWERLWSALDDPTGLHQVYVYALDHRGRPKKATSGRTLRDPTCPNWWVMSSAAASFACSSVKVGAWSSRVTSRLLHLRGPKFDVGELKMSFAWPETTAAYLSA